MNLERKVLDIVFAELKKRAYGFAASIFDPETGKHADVFVRRLGVEKRDGHNYDK